MKERFPPHDINVIDQGLLDDTDDADKLSWSQHVTITDQERMRLCRRGEYAYDSYTNYGRPVVVGPSCSDIYPLLVTDPYEYADESPLAEIELREIIASTTLAVLQDADMYTTIVGEDTSGRIPALIIRKAVNIVRERQGLDKVRGLFVSGRIDSSVTPDFQAADSGDAALLVTEYIQSGTSVNRAAVALARSGFTRVSVATLDRESSRNMANPPAVVDADVLYMGNRSSYTGRADSHLTWIDQNFKGVQKEWGPAHSARYLMPDQARINQMRADIAHFAEEIVAIWDVMNDEN